VYLRNPDQAKYLENLGVKSVIGDRSDLQAIKKATLASDVYIRILEMICFILLIVTSVDHH
jgi:hypothetical protein